MAGFNQLANTSRVVTAGTANQGLGPCLSVCPFMKLARPSYRAFSYS